MHNTIWDGVLVFLSRLDQAEVVKTVVFFTCYYISVILELYNLNIPLIFRDFPIKSNFQCISITKKG